MVAEQQPLAEQLLIGGAGGVTVFVLTTISGVVQRTRQRGRELRGLSRVLWPEMKRNWLAITGLKSGQVGHYAAKEDRPRRETWKEVRVKLSELMPEEDFDALARYYADLEMLEIAVTENLPTVTFFAGVAQDHEISALEVVEGYCEARWHPFKGYGPGPLKDGGWVGTLRMPLKEALEEAKEEDANEES